MVLIAQLRKKPTDLAPANAPASGSGPEPCQQGPWALIDHELDRRCENQRAERCRRQRSHGPLDQHRVDQGAGDDNCGQGEVAETLNLWSQAQPLTDFHGTLGRLEHLHCLHGGRTPTPSRRQRYNDQA